MSRLSQSLKGLKGNLARALRVAALNGRVGVSELIVRSATDATRVLEVENAILRGQMTELRAEVARLRQVVEARTAAAAMPPPPGPGVGSEGARPVKKVDLRVSGLVDSTTPAEVAAAVARVGGCSEGDIHTGEIRSSPSGLGTLWVRCPAAAARRVAVAGRITVGWTQAAVEALSARPLQCYRCLGVGHTRQRCTAAEDRSDCCYRCGSRDHKVAACAATPNCPRCAGAGKSSGHRLGSRACPANARRGKGGCQRPSARLNNKGRETTMAKAATTVASNEKAAPPDATAAPAGADGATKVPDATASAAVTAMDTAE
nr:uncharacterized protein LOC117221568 [Megalopta genalis]